jgi:RES domain-containing protein
MASRYKERRRAFRIADRRHALFDGAGAFLKGARWNSPGKMIIYAAETYAGALLEILVHANFDALPNSLAWIELLIPEMADIEEISCEDVPDWNARTSSDAQKYGDSWYDQQRTPVLLVPSVVTAGVEHNVLINQRHPGFVDIHPSEPREVIWDKRFLKNR